MRKFVRLFVDMAVGAFVSGTMTGLTDSIAIGVASAVGVAFYGVWCFWDGAQT